jgi:hypothetical protein
VRVATVEAAVEARAAAIQAVVHAVTAAVETRINPVTPTIQPVFNAVTFPVEPFGAVFVAVGIGAFRATIVARIDAIPTAV